MVDWGSFFVVAIYLGIHYQLGLVAGFIGGAITHYTLSKMFTFKSKSGRIALQFTLFVLVSLMTLTISVLLMHIFVEYLLLEEMTSRMLVTLKILLLNYFLHKNITFNKRIFKDE